MRALFEYQHVDAFSHMQKSAFSPSALPEDSQTLQ